MINKIEDIEDYEILAAKVLCPNEKVDGKWRTGLLKWLYFSAIEPFEESLYEGDYKVRPGYAYDKFYLNATISGIFICGKSFLCLCSLPKS